MNVKQQGISGYWLKVIAVISMLIDHTSAVILEQIPGLENPAFLMRIIGRLAFPIYCFLLVEGFYHTRRRAKYAGRLFLFALISEVPFDLAFSRRMWDFSSNNVFFTLLFGLLVIWGVEGLKQEHRSPFPSLSSDKTCKLQKLSQFPTNRNLYGKEVPEIPRLQLSQ